MNNSLFYEENFLFLFFLHLTTYISLGFLTANRCIKDSQELVLVTGFVDFKIFMAMNNIRIHTCGGQYLEILKKSYKRMYDLIAIFRETSKMMKYLTYRIDTF